MRRNSALQNGGNRRFWPEHRARRYSRRAGEPVSKSSARPSLKRASEETSPEHGNEFATTVMADLEDAGCVCCETSQHTYFSAGARARTALARGIYQNKPLFFPREKNPPSQAGPPITHRGARMESAGDGRATNATEITERGSGPSRAGRSLQRRPLGNYCVGRRSSKTVFLEHAPGCGSLPDGPPWGRLC